MDRVIPITICPNYFTADTYDIHLGCGDAEWLYMIATGEQMGHWQDSKGRFVSQSTDGEAACWEYLEVYGYFRPWIFNPA